MPAHPEGPEGPHRPDGSDNAGHRAEALRGPARVGAVAQVFVDDLEALSQERITLADEDAHHLTRSLRVRVGEAVLAADGRGHWRVCRSSGSGLLDADGPVEFDPAPEAAVTVGFVPVKGDRPEWVVQKLTEIGVDRVVVLRSARAVVRWDAERGQKMLERLRRVARQAAAQSRRAWVPDVDGIQALSELAERTAPAPLGLADPGAAPLAAAVRAVAVGPEGGWDQDERQAEGLVRVGLGPTILRAETAAMAAATLLCALRDGSLRTW